VDQTNYGEFARLDPVISQFPSLVELERIRVTLAFLKHHRYLVCWEGVNKKRCFDSPEIDDEFPV
jgi:hypothetical protein